MSKRSNGMVFAALLFIHMSGSAASAEDSFLFERDGFRIHYVGNGGNCNGCEWIAISGDLPPDAGELLHTYVAEHRFNGISLDVALNSNGGSLIGGIRLGRMIRALGMSTSVAKTIPDERFYKTARGECYSACAYAFLGGKRRHVDEGEYGVHQFFTDALLKNLDGKIFSPVDFSIQQTITGLLLSYVIEMGVSADLVVIANQTAPTQMRLLTNKQLVDFHVAFDPAQYGEWKLEPFGDGLVAFSRSQGASAQMTIYCNNNRAELLITLDRSGNERVDFKSRFLAVKKFSMLERPVARELIKLDEKPNAFVLHVPLTSADLDALQANKDPNGSFSVDFSEPRYLYGLLYERINLTNLAPGVRLVRRNCIH